MKQLSHQEDAKGVIRAVARHARHTGFFGKTWKDSAIVKVKRQFSSCRECTKELTPDVNKKIVFATNRSMC